MLGSVVRYRIIRQICWTPVISKYSAKAFLKDFTAQDVRNKLNSLNSVFFSGHNKACDISSQDHPFNLYTSGDIDILSTNYYYLMDCKAYSTLARLLPKSIEPPSCELDPGLKLIASSSPYTYRCSWAAAFISSPKLCRDWHVDWYDSLLVPLQGKKTIHFINSPTKTAGPVYSLYSYSDDHGFKPSNEDVKESCIIDVYPGEVLSIPAFYPHKVVNDPQQECVAVSLAFDNSYPLAQLIPSVYDKFSEGR